MSGRRRAVCIYTSIDHIDNYTGGDIAALSTHNVHS